MRSAISAKALTISSKLTLLNLLKLVFALPGRVLGVPPGFFVGVAPRLFLREHPILRPFRFHAPFLPLVALCAKASKKSGETNKRTEEEQKNKEV